MEQLEQSDEQDEVVIDSSAVASALEKLGQHPEPEVGFMRTTQGFLPAYNVQAAVDAKHAPIVAQQVTDQAADNRSLQPMEEAAQAATGGPFANLQDRIFGHPCVLLRGLRGAQAEISLGVAAYNLKRMQNILGGRRLTSTLRTA